MLFYLFFILIFQLFSSFYCFKGICEIIKLVDVGEASNDCSDVPNAIKSLDRCCIDLNCKMIGMIDIGLDNNGNCDGDAKYINHHCCDLPPCQKKGMEDVGPGMEGNCDGQETKYIDGRCCIDKKIITTTTTNPTTTPLGLYVNGRFYMNCLDTKPNGFCQLYLNRCMVKRNRPRNWRRNRMWINQKFMALNCCNSCQKAFKDFLPTLISSNNKYNRNDGYNRDYDYNNNNNMNDYNGDYVDDYGGGGNGRNNYNNRGWG